MVSRRLYRPAGVVLARVTTDPGDLELPDHLDFFDGDAVQGPGRQWLARVWERPEVQAAVGLASPAPSSTSARRAHAGRTPPGSGA